MITILIGTNRPGSNSRLVAQHLLGTYRAKGIPAQVLDLAGLPPELFMPEAYANKPARLDPFIRMITEASGLHVVVPEYNGSFPGVLKYFIDMLPFPESFRGRPVAFTGIAAGMFGALRPVEQLQQIFAYQNAYICPERVFAPDIGGSLSEDGVVVDEKLIRRLESQCVKFANFAKLQAEVSLSSLGD